jgi:hypothetical protein
MPRGIRITFIKGPVSELGKGIFIMLFISEF